MFSPNLQFWQPSRAKRPPSISTCLSGVHFGSFLRLVFGINTLRIPTVCEVLGLPETTAKTAYVCPLSQGLRVLCFSKKGRCASTGRPFWRTGTSPKKSWTQDNPLLRPSLNTRRKWAQRNLLIPGSCLEILFS